MSFIDYLVSSSATYPFMDGDVLFELADDDYREYAQHGLFSADHHGALRFEPTAQVIAANREQLDILIAQLKRMREEVEPRRRDPKPERLRDLIPEGGYGARAWPPADGA